MCICWGVYRFVGFVAVLVGVVSGCFGWVGWYGIGFVCAWLVCLNLWFGFVFGFGAGCVTWLLCGLVSGVAVV